MGLPGGDCRFWLGLFLFAVVLHPAEMAASLHRLQSGDGWSLCTWEGQCGVGKVVGGEVAPMDAVDEGVSCVCRGVSAARPAGVAAEGVRVALPV